MGNVNQMKNVCFKILTGRSYFALGYTVSVVNNNEEATCAVAEKPTSNGFQGNTIVSLTCKQPLVGQYLKISRAHSIISSLDNSNSLILCEVIVWGVIATYIRQGM